MRNYVLAGLSLLLVVAGMTLDYRLSQTDTHVAGDPTMPVLTGASAATTSLSPEQEKLSEFFTKHGSPAPREMAVAISHVKPKNRAVLAAVAVVESNGDPRSIGDNGDSRGAWQVQPKHWSAVPADAIGQALQAERILEELVASEPRGSLLCALSKYNSGSASSWAGRKYAHSVIKLAKGA